MTAQTFGALAGHLGTALDEGHGSVLDQTTAVLAYWRNKATVALYADVSQTSPCIGIGPEVAHYMML